MRVNQDIWRGRITYRSDLVARLTHLTGRTAENDDEAFSLLWKILMEKKLLASNANGYIIGNTEAVCFQEVPLSPLAENLLFEDRIKRSEKSYSWFGIRINKGCFFIKGGMPVIYGDKEELKKALPPTMYWRIVNLNLNDSNSIIDWTQEREWRYPGDFSFEWSDIEVVLKNHDYFNKFINLCFVHKQENMLKQINGIITLDSVIS